MGMETHFWLDGISTVHICSLESCWNLKHWLCSMSSAIRMSPNPRMTDYQADSIGRDWAEAADGLSEKGFSSGFDKIPRKTLVVNFQTAMQVPIETSRGEFLHAPFHSGAARVDRCCPNSNSAVGNVVLLACFFLEQWGVAEPGVLSCLEI